MFDSTVLETVIGLVFVYLLCSLTCSAIHDWIAGLMNIKAKALERRLKELLQNSDLVDRLYKHPIIKEMSIQSLYHKVRSQDETKPAHIEPGIFASALTDIIHNEGGIGKSEEALNALYKDAADVVKESNILKVLVERVNKEVDKAEDKVKELKRSIEEWFNSSMAHMSYWYKQKVRFVIFFIALALSAALNIDTIMISRTLYQDDAARNAVVKAAQQQLSAQGQQEEKAENKKVNNPIKNAEKLESQLAHLGFPVGWNFDATSNDNLKGVPTDFWSWFLKVLGILMTAMAASMGAPFWFDIMRRTMAMKGGKKG